MKHIFRFLILHATSRPFCWLLFCCFWQRIGAKHLASHLLCVLSYYCNLAVGSRVERVNGAGAGPSVGVIVMLVLHDHGWDHADDILDPAAKPSASWNFVIYTFFTVCVI